MQADPMQEWQRLSDHYREMLDGELLELGEDFGNLTETAQQVLRGEMKQRGLRDPQAPPEPPGVLLRPSALPWNSPVNPALGDLQSEASGAQEEGDRPPEYTWKTPLCACDAPEEAWQISEVLRRAGIESWIERPGTGRAAAWDEGMVGNFQVLVAADQLDAARQIAAQPIPQEIVEQSKIEPPEFEPPRCPGCGAADPVLESVDPSNSWLCEACGMQWTEPAGDLNESPEQSGS